MERDALERLELEADLRKALERNEFRLVYQPIVSLSDGQIVEVEALARWRRLHAGGTRPTDTQHAQLRELGCERGQGFLFAKPQGAAEVCDLLAREFRLPAHANLDERVAAWKAVSALRPPAAKTRASGNCVLAAQPVESLLDSRGCACSPSAGTAR